MKFPAGAVSFFKMVYKITAEQLKKKLDNKEPIIIVDVRTQEELQFGKINQAVHIPVPLIQENLNKLDKNKLIVLYCHSDQRSSLCARYLESNDFKTANLIPGILAWKKYQPEIQEY